MTKDVDLVRRRTCYLRFEALIGVDMCEYAETVQRTEAIEALDHPLLAPRVSAAAIHDRKLSIKSLQRVRSGEVAEQMALRRGELDGRYDEQIWKRFCCG